MPMGIVSDKDFDSELTRVTPCARREESKSIPITPEIVDIPKPGRKEGDVNVPEALRNVIGQTTIDYGRMEAVDLANKFGISPSSVSAYSKGATSTSSYDNRPNAGVIQRSKDNIAKRARARLMLALSHLTDEKLKDTKARDLAGIAKDMTLVARGMESDDSTKSPVGGGNQGPTFVFYSPQFFNEEKFETVVAKE
jgi:hypothetical protein